jgi:hypothetical protein
MLLDLALRLNSLPMRQTGEGGGGGEEPEMTALLIVVAGQSNAISRGTSAESIPAKYETLTDAYVWDGTDFVAYDPGTNAGTAAFTDAWGSEAEFIYQLNTEFPGIPAYVVKEALSGTPLASDVGSDWNPANDELYGDVVDSVTAARAWLAGEAVTLSHEVTLWNQGEADMTSPTYAAAYEANFAAFLTSWRTDVSDGMFICERTRPPGNEPTTYDEGYLVREAQHEGVNGDSDAAIIDLDFLDDGFADLHPDPTWVEGKGLRCYAAWRDTYTGTYGSIEDTTPSAFSILDVTEADVSSTVTSTTVSIAGIERASTVTLTGGEIRIYHPNDDVAVDWTAGPTTINKFQTFQVRQTSSASYETATTITVTIGGVSDVWSVTTGEETPTYDAATQAIIDEIADLSSPALGGSNAAALDDFIVALKAADVWDDIAVGYLIAMPSDVTAAKINIKNPSGTAATEAGTGTWSATTGYNPDATIGNYWDLNFSPSANPQNTVGIAAWFSSISLSTAFDIRSTLGSGNHFGISRRSNGDFRFALNSSAATRTGLQVDAGFYLAMRTASTTITFYGTAGTSIDSATTASGSPGATDTLLGHSTATPSNDPIAAVMIINATFDATKAQALRDALNALGLVWGWSGAA